MLGSNLAIKRVFLLLLSVVFLHISVASAKPNHHKFAKSGPAGSENWTNARRLAAGLSPLRPKRLFSTPTSPAGYVAVAQRAPSGAPQPCERSVVLRNPSGGNVGWISKHLDGFGSYQITRNSNDRLLIKPPAGAAGQAAVEIADNLANPYLGLAGMDMADSGTVALLVRSKKVNAGSTPQTTQSSYTGTSLKMETHIWTYTSSNSRLQPTWISSSRASYPISFYLVGNNIVGTRTTGIVGYTYVTLHLETTGNCPS